MQSKIKFKTKRRSHTMKKEEKKGLFSSIFGNKEKKSCCSDIEIEEITEDQSDDKSKKDSPKDKGKSCC